MASPILANQVVDVPSRKTVCPVCDSQTESLFFRLPSVPVNACVQWPTRESAVACARGNIDLIFCRHCGLIYNDAFDASLLAYGQSYNNALHHSQVFLNYADALAEELVNEHTLRGKSVVEIGCGDGAFLKTICRIGDNRGIGFDPSYVPSSGADDPRVRFVNDYYSERFAHEPADLVCCRQVFEHIPRPHEFLHMLRRMIGDRLGCVVMFEVPNTLDPLRARSIWDIIYEHCSYFTAPSLAAVFRLAGFDILRVRETFGGQYLVVEARPSRVGIVKSDELHMRCNEMAALCELVAEFAGYFEERVQVWCERLRAFNAVDARAVLWGAGARGVSFLNTVAQATDIAFAVDVNPRKHDSFLPGTAQRVVPPGFLKEYRPDHVILMNAMYEQEIRDSLTAMDLHPEMHLA